MFLLKFAIILTLYSLILRFLTFFSCIFLRRYLLFNFLFFFFIITHFNLLFPFSNFNLFFLFFHFPSLFISFFLYYFLSAPKLSPSFQALFLFYFISFLSHIFRKTGTEHKKVGTTVKLLIAISMR